MSSALILYQKAYQFIKAFSHNTQKSQAHTYNPRDKLNHTPKKSYRWLMSLDMFQMTTSIKNLWKLHLIEDISSPFGNHQHYHQWQTKANVARGFNQDDCQAYSHANYPTCKSSHSLSWHTYSTVVWQKQQNSGWDGTVGLALGLVLKLDLPHVLYQLQLLCYGLYQITCKQHTHTHTHNHFTALLEFVRDYPGEQVPER